MKLISVNVGLPREVTWKGKTVSTGIFKEPVSDRVMVRSLNLDGDGQADLTVHGALSKAIYVYPFEHSVQSDSVIAVLQLDALIALVFAAEPTNKLSQR
jgi:MOSC domain-containing protein YiiM